MFRGKAGLVKKNRQEKEADVNAPRMHFYRDTQALPCPALPAARCTGVAIKHALAKRILSPESVCRCFSSDMTNLAAG